MGLRQRAGPGTVVSGGVARNEAGPLVHFSGDT